MDPLRRDDIERGHHVGMANPRRKSGFVDEHGHAAGGRVNPRIDQCPGTNPVIRTDLAHR